MIKGTHGLGQKSKLGKNLMHFKKNQIADIGQLESTLDPILNIKNNNKMITTKVNKNSITG